MSWVTDGLIGKLNSANTMRLVSDKPVLMQGDILLVACMRNEELRLPWFIRYHRQLGVDHFLIIDNGSTDNTGEILASQPDVSVFYTEESYAESTCGINWQNEILHEFAIGHWALILDADELLVYPHCESLSLKNLTKHLDGEAVQAMRAPLLDMYSKKPIAKAEYESGESFLTACSYFDYGSYEFVEEKESTSKILSRGGPRHRLFWKGRSRDYPSPYLSKVPLVKWREELSLSASTHIMSGVALSDITGMLLHFKFLQDFPTRAKQETERKEHFAGARQYTAYSEIFETDPMLTAFYEGSLKYENSKQLIELGLIKAPQNFS